VVFVGHYENDHRLGYLQALCDSDIDFQLFGTDWDRARNLPWLAKLGRIKSIRGREYYRTLRSARIALCFFSTLNRDSYTRRTFEIPAVGTFMLSEYSDDVARLFLEGKEAEYFRNTDEMLSKIRRYLADTRLRAAVAAAGSSRVRRDGHDITSRMRSMIQFAQTA
jgi:spore maturation protein CgeB